MTKTLTKRIINLFSAKSLLLMLDTKDYHQSLKDNTKNDHFSDYWSNEIRPLLSQDFPFNPQDNTNLEIWEEVYEFITT
jgi:hypothetical protein